MKMKGSEMSERLKEIEALNARRVELCDAHTLREYTAAVRDLLVRNDKAEALLVELRAHYLHGKTIEPPTTESVLGEIKEFLGEFSQAATTPIVVNGNPVEHSERTMSYACVARLVGHNGQPGLSVTWHRKRGDGGSLRHGDTISVSPGMIFEAAVTGNA